MKVFLQKKVYFCLSTTKKEAEDNKQHTLSNQTFTPFEKRWKNYSYNFKNN